MFPSEWNTDDCDAKEKSKKKMGNGDPDSGTKEPQNIRNSL